MKNVKTTTRWRSAAGAAAICALSLTFVPGCGNDDDTLGEKAEEVGDEVGDAAEEAKDAAEDAVDEAGDAIDG